MSADCDVIVRGAKACIPLGSDRSSLPMKMRVSDRSEFEVRAAADRCRHQILPSNDLELAFSWQRIC